MKKFINLLMIVTLLTGFSILEPAVSQVSQNVIAIQVSPHILNLQNSGEVVTIHTDISYSLVVGQSVYLNGILIQSWKSDNQGNFVAKFNMTEVQALVGTVLNVNAYNNFVIIGDLVNGESFTGSEMIKVVNTIPSGGKN